MTLPRLTGPRVVLVPVWRELAVAVVSGDTVAAELGARSLRQGPGWPHADTADALRPAAEHGAAGGDAGWLIVAPHRADEEPAVVGDCGWRGGPDPDGVVELGYGLAAPARGQGIGTEAVAVLCAWAERQPGVRWLAADVLIGNDASRRVLRRLGFEEQPGTAVSAYVRYLRPAPGLPGQRRRIAGKHVC